jgi:hypothetical protein
VKALVSATLRARMAVVARECGSGGAGGDLLPGRPWWRGGRSMLAGASFVLSSWCCLFGRRLLFLGLLWLLGDARAHGRGGCCGGQVLLQEFFSGGIGRMVPFLPAGPNGCRAPTPLLRSGGFLLLYFPKWCVPGGGAAAALR